MRRRTATAKKRTASRTEYAVVYSDDAAFSHDYGCYATFKTRGAALDYAVDTVFERAENLEVDVLDSEDWKTVMTREQVRDQLAQGLCFALVLSFEEGPGWKDPQEYVSICVQEIEHYER